MTTDPSASRPPASSGGFASAWDDYARRSQPGEGRWPGDEWGEEQLWSAWFRRLFEPCGVGQWQRAVEIGQGSGRYTQRVLAAGAATVLALDVSEEFQDLCRRRFAAEVMSGRLLLRRIDERDPAAVTDAVRAAGWLGTVDAFFSIDTLVHLTMTQLAMLLLAASEGLRPGGWFIGTFANATSAAGLDKLVSDIDRVIRSGGDPASGCFHWTAPQAIRALAEFTGYEVVLCDLDPEHRRDGHFVLRFAAPERAMRARALRDRR